MAELNTGDGGGKKGSKKVRSKKSNSKVDLTAMVDLAFLLITFFMLTTSLSKPQSMDLGLPDSDGLELLTELRSFSKVPVIVLSVRNGDSDKIKALDIGAQDYVTKPFSVEELLARVRAQLRDRLPDKTPAVLDDGYLHIDLARRLVTCKTQEVELTPKEYAVLATLAQHRQCVITQKQLLEQIWGPTHGQDTHYLRIVISHLRQKIGDDPTEPKYLKTEAGIGYRLMI